MRGRERRAFHPRAWRASLVPVTFALFGCRPHDRDYGAHTPSDVPRGRPSGCVDTPFIGPDPYNASRGIDCSPRQAGTGVTVVRGKVVAEAVAGLPGPGLEGMLVSLHAADGTPIPTHLPESLAEATTDAQGAFVISAPLGAGNFVIAVRPRADQAAVTIQRIAVGDTEAADVLLVVPIDPELRESAERSEAASESEGPADPEGRSAGSEGPAPPPPVLPR